MFFFCKTRFSLPDAKRPSEQEHFVCKTFILPTLHLVLVTKFYFSQKLKESHQAQLKLRLTESTTEKLNYQILADLKTIQTILFWLNTQCLFLRLPFSLNHDAQLFPLSNIYVLTSKFSFIALVYSEFSQESLWWIVW